MQRSLASLSKADRLFLQPVSANMKRARSISQLFFWCALLPSLATLLFLGIELRGAAHGRLLLGLLGGAVITLLGALAAAALGRRNLALRINPLRELAKSPEQPPKNFSRPAGAADDELGALARVLLARSGEWRQLLERLQSESARSDAILKSMAEGVLTVDHNLRVIFCNDSLARLLGVQIPLPPRTALLDIERDPALTELIAQTVASRSPSKQTLQLASADARVFEVSVNPLDESPQSGAIAILHDVTDLERLERVRKDFVANVSHELRTPLTAIRGYAETLLDGAIDDANNRRKFLEVILAHSIRLNNIASDLLVLSELESGRDQAEPERISVRAAIEGAVRAVEPEAHVRKVAITTGALEESFVCGARTRLEQALINLIDNAVKFNRPGGSVTVSAGRTDGNRVTISISDDGVGIPSEDLSRIFERFYRVNKARSRDVGGTGLGLSIVKHVVERMNGAIGVESQLGKGAVFTISLPECTSSPG